MSKIFIEVIVHYTKDGSKIPLSIIWDDGRKFDIDKISDTRQAVSLKVGGKGIRYLCHIRNKKVYLFLDNDKWFIEPI